VKRTAAFPLLLALAAALQAQTAPPPLAFEVASIKPAAGDGRPRMAVHEGRLDFTGVSLRSVIAAAYKLEYIQITAPLWMDTVRFDIAAKIPEGVPKDRAPAMLQTLLKDRFKMKAHVETREGTSYALVAGKGEPKLKPAADTDEPAPPPLPDGTLPPTGPGIVMMRMEGPASAVIRMRGATMAEMSHNLSLQMFRLVVDETGIAGKYDIDLPVSVGMPDGWLDPAPGANMGAGPPPPPPPPTLSPAVIAKAVEQLGLKLETRRGPVAYLVVDSADRVPTGN
jgi:uncharacterized protein (TIGR03435 family)